MRWPRWGSSWFLILGLPLFGAALFEAALYLTRGVDLKIDVERASFFPDSRAPTVAWPARARRQQGAFRGWWDPMGAALENGGDLVLYYSRVRDWTGIWWAERLVIAVPAPLEYPAEIPITPETSVFYRTNARFGELLRCSGRIRLDRRDANTLAAELDLRLTINQGFIDLEEPEDPTRVWQRTITFERSDSNQLRHAFSLAAWLQRRPSTVLSGAIAAGGMLLVGIAWWFVVRREASRRRIVGPDEASPRSSR